MSRLLLVFFCLTSFCASAQTNTPVEKVVDERLGKPADIAPNRDQSFNLATRQVENPENNLPVIKYVVIRSYDWKIVEEGSVTMGQVAWSGDYEIEITHAPGQVRLARDTNKVVKKIDLRRYLKGLAPK